MKKTTQENASTTASRNRSTVELSAAKFFIGCFAVSVLVLIAGSFYKFPPSLIAAEVFLTVISLFIFGSIRYRLGKNALTYGAAFVIFSTFFTIWWPTSELKQSIQAERYGELFDFIKRHLLTLQGWDELVHADTMLFILGLTLFVSVIAQTRLLEAITFSVLRKTKGWVVPTVAILAFIVSFASGILDGVSMIGLMIRVLVMILFLAKIKDRTVVYAVMISTVVTTVCGMWLAYGEPPNLIMKANLHPYLDDAFFLRYCLPIAVGSYLIVLWNIRKRLKGAKVDTENLDVLDLHLADVRFLQAVRHGEVQTPTEFLDGYQELLDNAYHAIEKRLHRGEPLGLALVKEDVPADIRRRLLGQFFSENLAEDLDRHYRHVAQGDQKKVDQSLKKIGHVIQTMKRQRTKAQWIGAFAFVPFVSLLVWHAVDHDVPLFLASFVGFIVAFLGIFRLANVRRLALKEAKHEYAEYLFLFPLFFSITLLQKTGFFDQFSTLLRYGIEEWGISHLAYLQFSGTTFLSAILDNNVVADFAGRALHGLEIAVLHLFAMAQIAGYAIGGCWTHIGSAQSVVAYSFIRRQIDERYTPFEWIKEMTPIIIEIFILVTLIVYGEGLLLRKS